MWSFIPDVSTSSRSEWWQALERHACVTYVVVRTVGGEENETDLFQKVSRKKQMMKEMALLLTIPSPLHQMTAEQN